MIAQQRGRCLRRPDQDFKRIKGAVQVEVIKARDPLQLASVLGRDLQFFGDFLVLLSEVLLSDLLRQAIRVEGLAESRLAISSDIGEHQRTNLLVDPCAGAAGDQTVDDRIIAVGVIAIVVDGRFNVGRTLAERRPRPGIGREAWVGSGGVGEIEGSAHRCARIKMR